jgi:hypothetical protein
MLKWKSLICLILLVGLILLNIFVFGFLNKELLT